MTHILRFLIKIYSYLIRLYPSAFRDELQEQMLLDFSDMLSDARQKGKFALILFCLRELIDFPANLLRIHVREGRMFKILRSQPANNGLRGALGFGVAFAGLTVATWGLRGWLFSTFEQVSQRLPVWYYEVFRDYDGTLLFLNILDLILTALAGLILGVLLALLLGKRSQFSHYMVAGTLGWLVPAAIFKILLCQPFNSGLSLSNEDSLYLGMTIPVLQGAFLATIFNLVASERMVTLRRFVPGVILYPAVAYIYVKILFYFDLVTSPWLFVALMILLAVFLGSIFIAVMISDRKTPWMVIAGAVGYPVLSHMEMFIARLIHLPMPEPGMGVSEISPFMLQVSGVAQQAIFGTLFGLLLGLVFGFQKKHSPPSVTA